MGAFTASEAGEYMLTMAEGEENAYVSYFTSDSYGNEVLQNVELPYTLTLDQGEVAKFSISSADNNADTIDLVLSKLTDVYVQMLPGTHKLTMMPETNYNLRLGFATNPNGTLTWDNTAVTVTVDGLEASSPATIEKYSNYTMVVATTQAKADVTFTLEEEELVIPEMKLGENHIDAPSGYDGVTLTFTAPETGSYILSAMEGEENAFVSYTIGYMMESGVELPCTITLEAGTKVDFNVSPLMGSADTIDLLFRQICGHTAPSMVEAVAGVEAGDHSFGMKGIYICPDCGLTFDADGNAIDLEDPEAPMQLMLMPNHLDMMETVEEVAATTEKEGMKEHTHCTQCDKYFVVNESAETVDAVLQEVTKESLIIPVLPPYIPGDVDESKAVNILDVMMIINYITGQATLSDSQLLAADLTGDKTVNIFDAMALISIITG